MLWGHPVWHCNSCVKHCAIHESQPIFSSYSHSLPEIPSYYPAIKNNEILSFAATLMILEDIRLSEINHVQKYNLHELIHMWNPSVERAEKWFPKAEKGRGDREIGETDTWVQVSVRKNKIISDVLLHSKVTVVNSIVLTVSKQLEKRILNILTMKNWLIYEVKVILLYNLIDYYTKYTHVRKHHTVSYKYVQLHWDHLKKPTVNLQNKKRKTQTFSHEVVSPLLSVFQRIGNNSS